MFYLLENNRIIDSAIPYTKNFPFWEERDGCLYAKSVKNNIVRPYKGNKIKKQSENVYDFIDFGIDLIKHKINNKEYNVELVIGNSNILKKYETPSCYVSMYDILAIYKPNSKGDYIKVYEEGENK